MKHPLVTFFSLALILSGCISPWKMRQVKRLPENAPLSRLVTAHRANLHIGLPDNSLPAIREALTYNIPHLEIDVRQATNGDLFLFHDGSLNRSNYHSPRNLCGRIVQELTPQERSSVRLDPQGTIAIPLFSEALEVMRDRASVLQVDLKGESDQLAEAVIKEALSKGMLDRIIIQFRNLNRMQTMLERYPTLHALARCTSDDDVKRALDVGAEFIELEGWASAHAIESSHHARARVLVNIAHPFYDDRQVWNLLRSRGVDIIMTDHAACVELQALYAPATCADL
jgi:glycerophosphoryl diester phosphodiesterase